MKTQDSSVSRNKGGFSMERWRKLYVSAVEAPHHEDVSDSEPSSNLARIFVVLLLVHVFLIGAIVLYNVFSDHGRGSSSVESTLPQGKAVPSAAAVSTPSAPKASNKSNNNKPSNNQPAHHIVVVGDSLASVAQSYGVDQEAIVQANKIGVSNQFRIGMDLTIPAKASPGASNSTPAKSQPKDTKVAEAKKTTPPAAPAVQNDPPKSPPAAPVVKAIPVQGNLPAPTPTMVDAPRAISQIEDAPPKPKPGDRVDSGSSKPAPKAIAKASTEDTEDNPPKAVAKTKDKDKDDKPKSDTKDKDAKTDTKAKGKTRYHIVTENETLTSVAKKFKITVAALMDANNMNKAKKLHEGSKLKIPAPKNSNT